ncbi:hypothetical protein Tco_1435133 [Tanacetum coccineum]
MSSDSTSSEEPDSPEAAPASPNYVPGPEEPEQAPLSPNYPYAVADSPGYVADLDPEEDSEDGPVDYPADRGEGDDDDSFDDDEEEEEASKEDKEEHLASVDSVIAPVVDHVSSSDETEPFETDESATTPPSPLLGYLSDPRHLCLFHQRRRCLAAPALPSSPLPIGPHPYGSPNHVRAPSGFRAAMVDRREDIPEAELPPRKRLCLTTLTSRYEVGESSTAARPTGGHRVDYRNVWVDPTEAVDEVAPITLEGVNAKVTGLVAVQEEDTQDIYAVIEDAQDRLSYYRESTY